MGECLPFLIIHFITIFQITGGLFIEIRRIIYLKDAKPEQMQYILEDSQLFR